MRLANISWRLPGRFSGCEGETVQPRLWNFYSGRPRKSAEEERAGEPRPRTSPKGQWRDGVKEEKNVERRLDRGVLETRGGALVWRRTEEGPFDGSSCSRGALGDAQKVSEKNLLTL